MEELPTKGKLFWITYIAIIALIGIAAIAKCL